MRLIMLLAASALFVSCNALDIEEKCTLIGCSDGLIVRIDGVAPASYTVAVQSGGKETLVTCNPTSPCTGGTFVAGVTSQNVQVEIRLPDRTVRRAATVTYQETRPNGDDCEPVCRQAIITMKL